MFTEIKQIFLIVILSQYEYVCIDCVVRRKQDARTQFVVITGKEAFIIDKHPDFTKHT